MQRAANGHDYVAVVNYAKFPNLSHFGFKACKAGTPKLKSMGLKNRLIIKNSHLHPWTTDVPMASLCNATNFFCSKYDLIQLHRQVIHLTLLGLGLIKINDVSANFNNPRPSLILNN